MKRLKEDKRRHCNSLLYIRNVSDTVKDYFKAYCAKRGKTMSQVIKDFMKDSVNAEMTIQRDMRKAKDREERTSDEVHGDN